MLFLNHMFELQFVNIYISTMYCSGARGMELTGRRRSGSGETHHTGHDD
jgi:hypothetical protein